MASFLFAFPGRAHRRERLADLFWPDLDQEHSRAALNSAIWRMRKAIHRAPPGHAALNIRTVGSEIILEPNALLEIDAQLFEKCIQQALTNTGTALSALQRECLRLGLEQYKGPFLDGEDADWILEERERLHSMFVRAATILVKYYGSMTSYEDGIALVRRTLAFDPYRESAMRNLLVLLSLNDQRAEALRLYNRWRSSLKRELGVEPMPATVQLADELRACQSAYQFEAIKNRVFCIPPSIVPLRTDGQ